MPRKTQSGPYVVVVQAGPIMHSYGPFVTRLDANKEANHLIRRGLVTDVRVVPVFPPEWLDRD